MPEKCVYCGEPITFTLPAGHTDGDWYACERCAAMDEPCNCEHCVDPRDEEEEIFARACERTPRWDESACMGSMD